jgi:nucleotidyltransferase/DNA polymerase involved in DNA repair
MSRWVAYISSAPGTAGRKTIRRLFAILENYTPWIEHDGGGNAYLELGGMRRIFGHPFSLLFRIQTELARGGWAVSAGLGANKFFARAAADHSGTGGVFWILPQGEREFIDQLRIERWAGKIDRKSRVVQMRSLGVERVGDLAAIDPDWVKRAWGERGLVLRQQALGFDPRPVVRLLPNRGETAEQAHLFPPESAQEKTAVLRRLVSRLRSRYGSAAARWGRY